MYKIKHTPEDFFVREELKLELKEKGDYSYFILRKKNWNTDDAIREIANRLRIGTKRLGFAGNKDKQALTEQYVSVYKIGKDELEKLRVKDIEIKFIGYGDERINLGELDKNFFKIIVRNLDKKDKIKCSATMKIKNYFDEQRFGYDNENVLIGRASIKRDFKKVCSKLRLNIEKNNYIGALRKSGTRMLRFYLHAYSSYLWNEVVKNLKREYDKVLIIGFLSELKKDEIGKEYEKLMKKEKIKLKDFLFREFNELSCEGDEREMFMNVEDFKCGYDKDEFNKGKFKAVLEFSLGKGEYATMLIKSLFKN